jgi:hypothetical protein
MSKVKTLISQDNGKLQIPYEDYLQLMEKVQEGRKLRETRDKVIASLQRFLTGERPQVQEVVAEEQQPAAEAAQPEPQAEKVSVEFDAETESRVTESEAAEPERAEAEVSVKAGETAEADSRVATEDIEIPPIKKEIADHFNSLDETGRLFSVFKQYYTCLNESCGGTVRVTMKDGFCSLWNYDEWEEFAFVDVFEGHLRIAVDPRYKGELEPIGFCEVPRLLSSRRNLVCVMMGDLNNRMLDVLTRAFEEVGLAAS